MVGTFSKSSCVFDKKPPLLPANGAVLRLLLGRRKQPVCVWSIFFLHTVLLRPSPWITGWVTSTPFDWIPNKKTCSPALSPHREERQAMHLPLKRGNLTWFETKSDTFAAPAQQAHATCWHEHQSICSCFRICKDLWSCKSKINSLSITESY